MTCLIHWNNFLGAIQRFSSLENYVMVKLSLQMNYYFILWVAWDCRDIHFIRCCARVFSGGCARRFCSWARRSDTMASWLLQSACSDVCFGEEKSRNGKYWNVGLIWSITFWIAYVSVLCLCCSWKSKGFSCKLRVEESKLYGDFYFAYSYCRFKTVSVTFHTWMDHFLLWFVV